MDRTSTGTPVGYGPFDGRYYDESEVNEELGVMALWTGKAVAREYENHSGITKLVFTDGSWADLHGKTCRNAGPGILAIIRISDGTVLAG